MTDNLKKKDWHELAQLVAAETDPRKLSELVKELNATLLEGREDIRQTSGHSLALG